MLGRTHEPRPGVRQLASGLEVSERLDEDVLHHVFGVLAATGEVEREPKRASGVLLVEGCEAGSLGDAW